MKNRVFHVAIIGGGMGGLCLANGLKKAGISVAVYERDQSPESRPQDTAFTSIPKAASHSTNVYPSTLWDLFRSTGGDFSQGFSIVTQQLHEILHLTGPKLGVYDRERGYTAQGVIRPLKPVNGSFTVAPRPKKRRIWQTCSPC
jgi:flavin-dependent dehydrogenase